MTHLPTIACGCVCVSVGATPTSSIVPPPPRPFLTFLREFPALSLLSIFIASASLIIFGALYNMGKNEKKKEKSGENTLSGVAHRAYM